jgi:hypothetical protein
MTECVFISCVGLMHSYVAAQSNLSAVGANAHVFRMLFVIYDSLATLRNTRTANQNLLFCARTCRGYERNVSTVHRYRLCYWVWVLYSA